MIKKIQFIFFIFTFGINPFLISTKAELEKGFADGTIEVVNVGNNPQHKVKI